MPARPKVSWLPVRYIDSCLDEGRPTLEAMIEQAYEFGLRYLEIYRGFLRSREREYLLQVRTRLERSELQVSQITCAPDFTHPDPAEREAQYAEMVEWVQAAETLGATGVRVTAGCVHEGVAREDGLRWAAENLTRLAGYAETRGIRLGYENHYRDRRWRDNDFAFHTAEYLDLFELLRGTSVGVNFDASNQLMTGDDPMRVLEVVKHEVWHMHASDRFPGEYRHSVVGEGAVDFDAIFRCLAAIGYDGFISLEDGNPEGDEGTVRGLRFLRRKIIEHWG